MRANKKDDYTYTKELDNMESYFLNTFFRFLEKDNSVIEDSVEAIITEAVRRAKKEMISFENKISKKINNTCTASTLPEEPKAGDGPYFDLDIKKPIWFDGENWIDAAGNIIYTVGD